MTNMTYVEALAEIELLKDEVRRYKRMAFQAQEMAKEILFTYFDAPKRREQFRKQPTVE